MPADSLKHGRYRLKGAIGSGGMSQVFEAFDESLKRPVALKVLHPHLARDPEARARFAREAQATARLRHPNIVGIFDVADMDSPDAFIVTELIRGQTLRGFCEEHPLSPPAEIALCAMHQLASALEHAHRSGIIHRDLKPENVMLTETGTLKLMDFGIARILDAQTRMTMTGALVGSPLHMAPEIINGAEATAASDVFSAGTIFYWLVCGRPPFSGNNASQTLKNILEGTFEDPLALAPWLADEAAALIRQCLDMNPARRPQNGGELRTALEVLLGTAGIGDAAALLASFVRSPEPTRENLTFRMVGSLTGEAERALTRKPPELPRAVALAGRALALDANSLRARELLTQIQQIQRRRRRLGTFIKGMALTAAAAGMSALVLLRIDASPAALGGPDGGNAVPLTAGAADADAGADAGLPAREPASLDAASDEPVDAGTSPDASDGASEATPGESLRHETEQASSETSREGRPPREAPAHAHSPAGKNAGHAAVSHASPIQRGAPSVSGRKTPPAGGRDSNSGQNSAASAAEQPVKAGPVKGRLSVMIQHASQGLTWGKIFLDGSRVNGDSPSWSGEVAVGHHAVRAEAPCCIPETREVDVLPGEQTPPIIFRLPSKPALLSVISGEPCDIWLDGIRRSSCEASVRDPVAVPLPEDALRGKVTFVLVRPGKADVTRTEKFEAGQAKIVRVEGEAL